MARVATDGGPAPTTKASGACKVPSPLPSSTETSLESKLATARSGLPSPLKSPTATESGDRPAAKSLRAMNDTVWAGAGSGNVDRNNKAAPTSRDSRVEYLVKPRGPLEPGESVHRAGDCAGREKASRNS